VTNDVTIRTVLLIRLMANWVGELFDINGSFLHGDFNDGKNVYMEVPEGFAKYYHPMHYVLLLLQTIYGLVKQSAMAFWKKLLMAFHDMKFARSKADPCLYYSWTPKGLTLWISWIYDCLGVAISKTLRKLRRK
jgi:hypothetical protein